jgi:hypothetical protein
MKKLLIVLALLLVLPCVAFAVDFPIPDTVQTKCYNNTAMITCPSSGEALDGPESSVQAPIRSHIPNLMRTGMTCPSQTII